MSEAVERVREELRLVERIGLFIPGYRGYKEKEIRREADRLLREYLLRKLRSAYEDFKGLMAFVAAIGRGALYETYNQVQATFDRVIARLRTADYGYAGFFDAVKIEEPELDSLIKYDYGLVEGVEKVSKKVAEVREAALSGDPSKVVGALVALRSELESLDGLLTKREDVIARVGRG